MFYVSLTTVYIPSFNVASLKMNGCINVAKRNALRDYLQVKKPMWFCCKKHIQTHKMKCSGSVNGGVMSGCGGKGSTFLAMPRRVTYVYCPNGELG